mmetsp:Transcript_10823/g.16328  ORF Transcript_10823/g.16328 Transcript_10823/m.16328 type:complete len:657 (+) Transcript_10823:60-2030(+)|eukprot:scaffold40447_cov228-Skeletonema_dohrnii-CCMP3373.AAC.4
MSSSTSSRIPEMYSRFRSTIQQLDELESRISNRVASLRRRTTHLVEEVPTHRRTHMRIFISHRLQEGDGKQPDASAAPPAPASAAPAMKPGGGKDFGNLLNSSAHEKAEKQAEEAKRKESDDTADGPKKGIRRWTLVIEGGLLIKHLDHVSAKEVDRRLENGLPILGCMQDDDNDNNGGKTEGGLKRELWPGGVAERQDEKVIDPLLFTHLFDKLEVEMSIVKKSKKTEVAPPSTKKTFTWERSKANTADSNAFFIVHDEEHEFKPMGGKVFKSEFNVDHIDAKIKLFRRQGDDEENFIPTPSMCEVFFPSFIGLKSDGDMKTKDKIKKSKKRKLTLSVSGSSLDKSANTSTQSSWMDGSSSTLPNPGAAATDNNIVATGVAPIGEAPPQVKLEEKEGVPNTITMDEAVAAVFFYVRSRGLQDPHDASIINNDEQLSKLFGCNRMLLSAVRPLLIQKGLLVKVEPCTHPIIFNYAMTQDGKEPLEQKKNDVEVKKEDDAKSGRRRTSTVEKAASADEEEEEEAPMQTMLSCDIDVQVPNLYHNRSKDVLRRIKNREFEYTSARTRAFRSLLATFVHEDTARQVLGDAARGRGYASYHKKAWMALAQGSVEGGEAQKAAMIDLRTTSLVEKLEERCTMAQGFASVVQACKGLGDDKK